MPKELATLNSVCHRGHMVGKVPHQGKATPHLGGLGRPGEHFTPETKLYYAHPKNKLESIHLNIRIEGHCEDDRC